MEKVIINQEELTRKSSRLIFEITTRGLLGLRGALLTITKGTSIISSMFIRNEVMGEKLQQLRKGVLVASHRGKALSYGLESAQEKGPLFIEPQDLVYEGMIVGLNGREEDLEVNVCKEKKLSNVRSVGEYGIFLTPPLIMSLEQQLGFIEEDELLEITPQNLRLRKKVLDSTLRRRNKIH